MPSLPDKLEKERVALLVIDLQTRFRDIIFGMNEVLAGSSRLIRFCHRLDIPILVTEHYPQGLGPTLPEVRSLFPEFKPVEKVAFSCCGDAGFVAALEAQRREQWILCGIETHICVYQTAYDLLAGGRQVCVATDAVSSRRAADRENGLAQMSRIGVQTMNIDMMLYEILRVAQTEDFRLVADILKE